MNANTTESLRLFFALWPDDETRTALMQLQAPIRGRTISYDNLHLTLAFLGQQPASLLPALKQILTHLPPLAATLTLDRIGYFTRSRIAWAGMHDVPDALLKLQQELAQTIVQHGISFNNQRDFKPHVTLARDASLPPDIIFTPIVWRASQIVLVQSATQAEGASYQVLASRSLDEECWTSNESGLGQ
jgi:2'-5' RNA ligase